jgi:hypothetical protein
MYVRGTDLQIVQILLYLDADNSGVFYFVSRLFWIVYYNVYVSWILSLIAMGKTEGAMNEVLDVLEWRLGLNVTKATWKIVYV